MAGRDYTSIVGLRLFVHGVFKSVLMASLTNDIRSAKSLLRAQIKGPYLKVLGFQTITIPRWLAENLGLITSKGNTMTDQKPLPVKGYTDQNDENIELVNANKVLEEKVLRQLDLIGAFSDVDQRWLAVARTNIEQGFMAANRAVFKPERIEGDLPK